jgi:hyaluronan synthase
MKTNSNSTAFAYKLYFFLLKMFVVESIALVIVWIWRNPDILRKGREMILSHDWGVQLMLLTILFASFHVFILGWRLILFLRYRPVPSVTDAELPTVTVVVPAYNEGIHVYKTLKSLLASDYPSDKMTLVAVDDGSRDDTWTWIEKAYQENPDRIVPLRQMQNRGKREALYRGFRSAPADVFVTVDSDSLVDQNTLRNLVSPFMTDERVGAVAGNVRVENSNRGALPMMMDTAFVFSFEFIRAGQSVINTVMCTPGALSAYRGSVLLKVLNEWLGQTFMGRRANIGEDRALTNLILREGYLTRFQKNALVYTEVPMTYRNLYKMLLRWARSNVRETIAMSHFIFKNFRKESKTGARINFIVSGLLLSKGQLLWLVSVGFLLFDPTGLGMNFLFGLLIGATIPALFYILAYRSSDGLYVYLYTIYWFFSLSWVTPFALLTPHVSGWLTRQNPEPKKKWGQFLPGRFSKRLREIS